MLKVLTLFSGIGSPEIALRDLQMPYELVDFCEFDKYAIKSYCAVHGVPESKNLGDITKVWGRNLPYADLLVWGFPCTDISVAGKQSGVVEGKTRSGLYYKGLRVLKESKPKYSIIENVKNLTGKQFKETFASILNDIEELGYTNYWKVLNAKDFGIPQNRERVFIVSIRDDIDLKFEFPIGFDNGLRLKDFLEDEVDEKFYISQEKTEKLISQLKDKVIVKEATKKGYTEAIEGDNINIQFPDSKTRRGRVGHEIANTLETSCNQAVVVKVGNTTPSGKSQCNDVVAAEGIYPNICAGVHGNCNPSIIIPCITPDRVEKRQNGRRFKEDGDPMFTLTGQDRHGILEIGKIEGKNYNQNKVVYDVNGVSPTIQGQGHCGNEPKILQVGKINSSQDGIVHDINGISQCLSAGHGNTPKILEPNEIQVIGSLRGCGMPWDKRYEAICRVYDPNGLSPTVTAGGGGGIEPKVMVENKPVLVGGIGEINFGKQYRQGNRVYSADAKAMCLLAQPVGNAGGNSYLYQVDYRIRKLTSKECWRLMGFTDEDFQKAVDAGVSNSQLYKQAGNSIVSNVLKAIFAKLLQTEIAQLYEDEKELS